MGANTSALLSEELEEISRQSNMSQVEVKRLYNRFQKLDRKQSGTLDSADLLMIPELAMNPLHPRLLTIFQNNNFRQFVANMSAFSGHANPAVKVEFAFRIYDVDADGFISANDLLHVLRMLVGDNIPPHTLDSLIKDVISEADIDGDGQISRSEFINAIDQPAFAAKLQLPL